MLGGVVFLLGVLVVLGAMVVLAAVGLVVMALVALVMGAERLLGVLVPGYRRRRAERYLKMPTGLIRVVRFQTGPTRMGRSNVIEAHSSELPPPER